MARSKKRKKRKGKGKARSRQEPSVVETSALVGEQLQPPKESEPAAEEESPEEPVPAPEPVAEEGEPPAVLELEQAAAQLDLGETATIALISAGRVCAVRRNGRLEVASAQLEDKEGLSIEPGAEGVSLPPEPPREVPKRLWPLRDAILALREPLPEPDEPPPEPEPPPLRIRIGVGLPAVPPADRRELSFARTYSSMKSEFGDEPVLIARLSRREVRGFRFGPDLLVPRKDLQGLPMAEAPALRAVEEPLAIPGVTVDWVKPLQLRPEEREEAQAAPTRAETQLGLDIVDEEAVTSSSTDPAAEGQVAASPEASADAGTEAPVEGGTEAPVEGDPTAAEAKQSQLDNIVSFLGRTGEGDDEAQRKVLVGSGVVAQVARTAAVLVGVHGEQRKAWRLGSGFVMIGRGREMSGGEQRIVLDDSTLAMDHASITWNGNGFDITDLGHASGTRVGGRRLAAKQPQSVETGVLIQAGGLNALLLFSKMGLQGKRLDASEMPAKALLDYLRFRKVVSQERARDVEREMARAEVSVEEVLVVAGDVEPVKLKELTAEAAKVDVAGFEASESEWMALLIRFLVVLVVLGVLGTVAMVLLSG